MSKLDRLKDVLQLDRIVHEPARLAVLALLNAVKSADFIYLMNQTGLTQGNLSAHLSKLEEAGLVKGDKTFVGKRPKTTLSITPAGRKAFRRHAQVLAKFLRASGEL